MLGYSASSDANVSAADVPVMAQAYKAAGKPEYGAALIAEYKTAPCWGMRARARRPSR